MGRWIRSWKVDPESHGHLGKGQSHLTMALINRLNAGNLFYSVSWPTDKDQDPEFIFVYDDHFVNDLTRKIITAMIKDEGHGEFNYETYREFHARLTKLMEAMSFTNGSSIDLTLQYLSY